MPHPRPSWPRRLRRVCVFLLLGLVTTVGVAWGSAMLWYPEVRNLFILTNEPPYDIALAMERVPGGAVVEVVAQTQQREPASLDSEPRFAGDLRYFDPIGPRFQPLGTEARGWPLLALRTGATDAGSDRSVSHWRRDTSRGALPIRWLSPILSDSAATVVLPLIPNWPGLLADVVFFAAVFAAPNVALGSLRHSRRRRWQSQGRCPGCGYDMRGLGEGECPECGHNP